MTLLIPACVTDFYLLQNQDMHIPERKETMNPWEDPFLDYLQSLMLGCLQGIKARPPHMTSAFWQQMPVADQLLAEIESEVLESLFRDLWAIQCLHIQSEYLPFLDLPLPGTPTFQKFTATLKSNAEVTERVTSQVFETIINNTDKPVFRFEEIAEYLQAYHAPVLLTPVHLPETRLYTANILEMNLNPNRKLLTLPGDDETLSLLIRRIRLWQDEGIKIHHLTMRAHGLWGQELMNARLTGNALTGPASRNRTLLVDSDIPLVTIHNFHAWWSLCGIEAIKLPGYTTNQFYFAFTHPHLAVTKDHLSNTLQTEDSHANHSLPGRSGGHVRTEGGKVIHGRHHMWAFQNDMCIHDIQIENSMMTRPASKLRADMPFIPSRVPDSFYGQHDILSVIQDPWQSNGELLFADWMRDYPISTGIRHVSKSYGYNFMFTDTPTGKIALNAWRESMMQSALQWLYWMHGPDRELKMIQTIAEQAQKTIGFKLKQSEAKTKSAKRFNFDFSGLNM